VLRLAGVGAALLAVSVGVSAQRGDAKAHLSFADVQPLWTSLQPVLPSELIGKTSAELESAWPEWLRAHDRRIRERVARGDEDSLVNLWLFGTSFTKLPPARPQQVATFGRGAALAQVIDERLDDLLAGLASPRGNARLASASEFLRSRDIDPATWSGRARARELLRELKERMVAEDSQYTRALEAPNPGVDPVAWMIPYSSLYRDRGLSSDTSILSSFAIDSTLEALKSSGMLGTRPIRRVAVIGPGLDFINKADGHDFYREQTIQPFTLIDSLIRLGLARADELSVMTFDVSAKVNQHLAGARARARDGYIVHLPLADSQQWSKALVEYWERAGRRIGEEIRPARAPDSVGHVKVRAVRIRPEVVLSVMPHDVNIIVERLEPGAGEERFDLVVATNVFVYYDRFEQALALMNIGRMLRPGGSLLSNQAIVPVAPMKPAVGHDQVVYSDRQFDHVFWYQRE
jgi:SAM-dependent methyltransferase